MVLSVGTMGQDQSALAPRDASARTPTMSTETTGTTIRSCPMGVRGTSSSSWVAEVKNRSSSIQKSWRPKLSGVDESAQKLFITLPTKCKLVRESITLLKILGIKD